MTQKVCGTFFGWFLNQSAQKISLIPCDRDLLINIHHRTKNVCVLPLSQRSFGYIGAATLNVPYLNALIHSFFFTHTHPFLEPNVLRTNIYVPITVKNYAHFNLYDYLFNSIVTIITSNYLFIPFGGMHTDCFVFTHAICSIVRPTPIFCDRMFCKLE